MEIHTDTALMELKDGKRDRIIVYGKIIANSVRLKTAFTELWRVGYGTRRAPTTFLFRPMMVVCPLILPDNALFGLLPL